MSGYFVLSIHYLNRPPESRNILAAVTTIGRENGDIVLLDPLTSSRHAEIHFQSGRVSVRDTGSTNGTFLNGQRLSEFVLEPGQMFYCGRTALQLVHVHAPQAFGPSGTVMAVASPEMLQALNAGGGGSAAAPQHGAYGAPQPQHQPMGYAAPQPQQQQPMGYAAPQPQHQPMGYAAPTPQQQPMGYAAPQPQQPPMGYAAPQLQQQPQQPMGYAAPQPQQPPMGYAAPEIPTQYSAYGPADARAPQEAARPVEAAPAQAADGTPPGQAIQAVGVVPTSGVRTNFQGKGGELFVTLLVGGLLTLVTLGIYMPWFICKLARFVLSNTTVGPTGRGELKLEFTGKGGELFVLFLVGGLLTLVTIGIYAPWFICKELRYFADNTWATAQDGTRYRLRFEGQGGDLLVTILLGYLLMIVTLGIYAPWLICKLHKTIYSRTVILENEQPVGGFDFEGKGGELFVTTLVGVLLSVITLGIYIPWFQVKMYKFFAAATRVTYQGRVFGGEFLGTGGEYLVTFLVGILLTIVTIYIYFPWFIIKQWQFQWNNRVFKELPRGAI